MIECFPNEGAREYPSYSATEGSIAGTNGKRILRPQGMEWIDEFILRYENAGSHFQAQMMQPQVNPLPWLCQAFQAVFGIASEVSARICNVCPFYARNHVLFICRIAEKAMFRKLLHTFHPFHSLDRQAAMTHPSLPIFKIFVGKLRIFRCRHLLHHSRRMNATTCYMII